MSSTNLNTTAQTASVFIIGEAEIETRKLADALALDFQISAAPDLTESARRLAKQTFGTIIYDLDDGGENLTGVLASLQQMAPDTPIIVLGHSNDAELIVSAIKAGASDFVAKPYPPEKIKLSVHQALETRSLKNELDYLRREQDVVYDSERIIAVSPPMQDVIRTIKRLAETDSTILVTGETGTGKSYLSGNIHFNSPRRHKPFIKVNCANIQDTLLESELFGHEKGSFTGADKTRTGRFEQANGGTIFLDEFCELGLELQAKLLRGIEDKSFERLGGSKTIHADTRIIAATNRDIESFVQEGNFRQDLYYRINVLRIHLPPLRERVQCIEPLAHHFLAKLGRSMKKKIEFFAPEVLQTFRHYPWPGNIRQLSNTIERAILMEGGTVIQKDSISLPKTNILSASKTKPAGLKLSAEEEKDLISRALENNLWIQKDAARQLGITPRALNYRIKKLGITHDRWRKNK